MEHITFSASMEVVPELTERCDRCGAAAKLTCVLAGGGLAFCGHHANLHAETILRSAVTVQVVTDFAWRGASATSVSTVDDWQIADRGRPNRPYRNETH